MTISLWFKYVAVRLGNFGCSGEMKGLVLVLDYESSRGELVLSCCVAGDTGC